MYFEEALLVELKNLDGFNKVSPGMVKQGTPTPYLFYLSSETNDKSLGGYLESGEVFCEINIVTDKYSQLAALRQLVVNKLISFQSRTIGNSDIYIQNVIYESPVNLYEKDINQFRCLIDCKFKF
jgi:hypothetical protein